MSAGSHIQKQIEDFRRLRNEAQEQLGETSLKVAQGDSGALDEMSVLQDEIVVYDRKLQALEAAQNHARKIDEAEAKRQAEERKIQAWTEARALLNEQQAAAQAVYDGMQALSEDVGRLVDSTHKARDKLHAGGVLNKKTISDRIGHRFNTNSFPFELGIANLVADSGLAEWIEVPQQYSGNGHKQRARTLPELLAENAGRIMYEAPIDEDADNG